MNKQDNFYKKYYLQFTPRQQDVLMQAYDTHKDNLNPITDLKQWLLFQGPLGSWKTISAIQTMADTVYFHKKTKHLSSRFVFVSDWLDMMRESYSENSKASYTELMKEYIDVDILILDDFATQKINDWVNEMLYKLINSRYEYYKTTIFTTNISLEKLQSQYREKRVLRRIAELAKIVTLK